MRDAINFLRRNYVLQIIIGLFLFGFYVTVFSSVATFFNIQAISYMNYMFFFAALALLYGVLPKKSRQFI
jgi:hypothetical protein